MKTDVGGLPSTRSVLSILDLVSSLAAKVLELLAVAASAAALAVDRVRAARERASCRSIDADSVNDDGHSSIAVVQIDDLGAGSCDGASIDRGGGGGGRESHGGAKEPKEDGARKLGKVHCGRSCDSSARWDCV